MRQIKIKLSIIFSLMGNLFGMNGLSKNGYVKVTPGLVDFVSDISLKYHLNRLGKKLEDHQKSFQEEDKALKIKVFGEDESKWSELISVPEDENIPKEIEVAENDSIPQNVEELGTNRLIPNPEYKTKKVPNPDYKEKLVPNEKWSEYEEAREKLLNTEIELSIPILTLSDFKGINLSYCVPVKKDAAESLSSFYRISDNPEAGESKVVLNISSIEEHVILMPVDDESLKDHKYEKGQTRK